MSLSRIHAHALAALAALSTLRDPSRAHARAVSTLSGAALSVDFSSALAASVAAFDTYEESEPATVRVPVVSARTSEVCS